MRQFDRIDLILLEELQKDADRSLDQLAERAGLSRNALWRRMKGLEAAGIIRGRVALLDPKQVGCGLMVFISIRTNRHDAAWAEGFRRALALFPEITGAFRMTGELDYLLQARVADVAAYDALYARLIAKIELSDVSASFVMEEMKATTALPLSAG